MGRGVVKENKIEAGRERKYLNIKPLYFPLFPLYILIDTFHSFHPTS